MDSPSLSRSPSQTFGPSRGRRSQTNVHHLSLAPLTPKFPVDVHDYTAYFDPDSQQLHTSASLSQVASLPQPGGILTKSPAHSRQSSRANSRVRKKVKSSVSIQAPSDIPSGALSSEGFGHKSRLSREITDPSWLIQTGLTLTEGSRETKGQSWIIKRDSSTSLQTPDEPRRTPARSRDSSRRRSKRSLAMTPAAVTPFEQAEPDWADSLTRAELEARAEMEDYDDEDEDPYGALDFEENFELDDEEAVRQAISQHKLGRWFDDAVNVMLKLEDKVEDRVENSEALELLREIEPPPNAPQGVWEDVMWFGRLLARTVRS